MSLRPYSVELLVRVRVPVIAESSQAAAQIARARVPDSLEAAGAGGIAAEVGVARPVRGPVDATRTSNPLRPLLGAAALRAVRQGQAPEGGSVMDWLRYAQEQGEQVEDRRQGRLW